MLLINKHPREIFNFGNCYLGIFFFILVNIHNPESAMYLWCSIQLSETCKLQLIIIFTSNNNYDDGIPQLL